jgi:alginate O-acetyltransferase complex protein AlgI
MVFSSLVMIYVFLPIVLLVYFLSPNRFKNFIILVAGLIFYAWGEPVYIWVMIVSSLVDYMAGLFINKYDDNPKVRKLALIISMTVDLGFLVVFKYSGFFISNVNTLLNLNIPIPDLPLPIGISFYTFQSMSYTIDLYWRKIKVQKNFLDYLAYVSLFPQLVAGPIVRYEDVQNEISERKVNIGLVGEGVNLFIKGLAKKVLLANNIGTLWTEVKALDFTQISALTAWMGILSFTFQIYYDFSGYSDMAIGLGKMLGFHFPKNFDHPYISKSVSEFWRRWHITMGSWFREYVYIPLGGNRCSKAKMLRNTFIVWAVTGFWHGADWNFILWGLFYGVILTFEKLYFHKVLEKLPSVVRILYTFVLVVMGWVLFDTESLTRAGQLLKAMFGFNYNFVDSYSLYQLSSYIVMFLLCAILSTNIREKVTIMLTSRSNTSKLYYYSLPVLQLATMVLCTAYLVDASYNPFLYFRF